MKKIISLILLLSITASIFAGCSENQKGKKYDMNAKINTISTSLIVSEENLELSWNNEGKFIVLTDKKSGKIWSGVPYKYFESGGSSDNVNSPINITVVNAAKAQWDTINGCVESVKKNRVSAEKIDKGLKITYYFDNYKISVPVKYELKNGGLNVSVDSSEIVEDGDNVLLSVAVAPFLCAAENITKDSYLFVPSGSGSLMYVDERAEGTRKYTAEVYGEDDSRLLPEEVTNKTKIYLPVYGVKEDKNALFAVIGEGAEYAEIYAEAGNRRTGYSTVYSTFYLRGYDVVETDQWLWGYRDLNRISDTMLNTKFAVTYYPLSGDDADYNGMAKKYKELLFGDSKSNTQKDNPIYSLDILGGVTYKSASWGIPHKELYTLTTFSDAQNIIKRLDNAIGLGAYVALRGFSSSGIDVGKIGGGFDLPGDYGNEEDFKNLINYCKDSKTKLSYDFDLVRFNRSSSGYSYMLDSAKSATLRNSNKYGINIPLRSYNDEEYRLLSRSKLDGAVDELIEFAKDESINNVSLSTLASIAYSDFAEEKYSVKGNMASQVTKNIEKIKKSGMSVSLKDANGYGAVVADILTDVPDNNGDYFSMDKSIPFYQLVYSGKKEMYSKALNLSENLKKSVVDAVSSGVRFGFTVAQNYDMVCASSKTEKLYGTKFSSNEENIINLVAEYKDFYESINGCGIESYTLSDKGISKTVFDNGVTVYANHQSSDVETTLGVFKGYEIRITH